MAQKNRINGILLLLLIALAIFAVYNYNGSNSEKEYYYKFSQLDLLNTSHEVVQSDGHESLKISNHTGLETYVLETPSQDLVNATKYTIEYSIDVQNLSTNDSLSVFLSQDSELTGNETNRDNLAYETQAEYFGAFFSADYDSFLAEDLVIGSRNDVGNVKFKIIHEVDLSSENENTNTIISTLVDNETISVKSFSLQSDIAKDNSNPLVFDSEGKVSLNLLSDWNTGTPVSISEGNSYLIEYIKVYDVE